MQYYNIPLHESDIIGLYNEREKMRNAILKYFSVPFICVDGHTGYSTASIVTNIAHLRNRQTLTLR